MKRLRQTCLTGLIALVFIAVSSGGAAAERGIPGSAEFGFGAALRPKGADLTQALAAAADLNLDWIQIELDWAEAQPDPGLPPGFEPLDPLVVTASQQEIAVLVSVTHAPAWALTSFGPQPALAADLVAALVQRFPGQIQAVELFPGANTTRAWQGQVSPQAYYQVYLAVNDRLAVNYPAPVLVGGGLVPLAGDAPKGEVQDLLFLSELYGLGAANHMPVISLRYASIAGDLFQLPSGQDAQVLRRYEDVRRIMVENQHETGRIWITQFPAPSGKINVQDLEASEEQAQATWYAQAYVILRSQLYLGVAFLPSLNSEGEGTAEEVLGLVKSDGSLHPFYPVLREMISQNQAAGLNMPGKAKEGNLSKKRPLL